MNEKKTLLDILDIIDYQDDKPAFVDEFFSLIYAETVAQMDSELDEQSRKNLSQEFDNAKDNDDAKEIILKYFSKEKFDEKITKITQEQFEDYLETIYPTLDEETQGKLTDYLNSLPKPE
jgi:hypothetical protein